MTATTIYPARPRFPGEWQWLAPFASRWTYTRFLFLALAFPLGLLYFVSLLVGGVVGGVLIWTIPGLLLVILEVLVARWYGDLEAELVRRLVGVSMRRPPTWYERDVPIREQAKQLLLDPSTWTGLIYLASRFPIGIAAFISVVFGVAFSGFLMTAPLTYDGAFVGSDIWGDEEIWIDFMGWRIDTLIEAWAVVPLGVISAFVALHVWNLEAWLIGHWARLMLGSRARDIPAPPATLADADAVTPVPADVIDPRIAALTPREREVLLLIARGYSNAEIAEAFVVSEGTVKTHVKRILGKLEVRDRTQAAVIAFDSGFVTPETASEPEPR